MAWTNVSKPSTQTWTAQNSSGKEQYDDVSVIYDSTTSYYDGINPMMWTRIQEPSAAWNLSVASFVGLYTTTAQTTRPEYAYFSPDGVYLFVGDGVGGKTIYQYTLGTPWDVSTKSLTRSTTFASLSYIEAIFFNDDGSSMYLLDNNTPNTLNQYSLSTDWDISTTSLTASVNINALTGDTDHTGLYFRPDGQRLVVVGDSTNKLYDLRLPSAWNITSAILNQSVSIADQTLRPDGIYFKPDGTKMYISQYTSASRVFEYVLSESWNIATAVYNQTLTISSSDLDLFSIFFKSDGTQLYAVVAVENGIRVYNFPEQWTKVAKPT